MSDHERPARTLGWLGSALIAGVIAQGGVIAWRFETGRLGPNPISSAQNQLGLLALILLLATLACTPLFIVYRVGWPLRVRRVLGLAAFGVAATHVAFYLFVDQRGALGQAFRDVVRRPFIAAGLLAFALLVPLALTSSRRALQRMGRRRWQRLHRLVYVAAALGVVHYALRVKADFARPALYGAVLAGLLGLRALVAFGAARTTDADRRRADTR